jgi:arylsulfatase A-like enzyme
MMPTLLAAAGVKDVKEKLLKGYNANGKTFKCHLDGYNLKDFWAGKTDEAPRKEIFYFDAGGNLNAIRYNNWKLHFTFMEGSINEAYRKTPAWPLVINLEQILMRFRLNLPCIQDGMQTICGYLYLHINLNHEKIT